MKHQSTPEAKGVADSAVADSAVEAQTVVVGQEELVDLEVEGWVAEQVVSPVMDDMVVGRVAMEAEAVVVRTVVVVKAVCLAESVVRHVRRCHYCIQPPVEMLVRML